MSYQTPKTTAKPSASKIKSFENLKTISNRTRSINPQNLQNNGFDQINNSNSIKGAVVATKKTIFTVTEAAQYLGVHADTLRNWEQSGKLNSNRAKGQRRRYTLSQLNQLSSVKRVYFKAPVILDQAPISQPVAKPAFDHPVQPKLDLGQILNSRLIQSTIVTASILLGFLITSPYYSTTPQNGQAQIVAIKTDQNVLGASTHKPNAIESWISFIFSPWTRQDQTPLAQASPSTGPPKPDSNSIALNHRVDSIESALAGLGSNKTANQLVKGTTYTDLIGPTILDSYGNVYPSNLALGGPTAPTLGTNDKRYGGLYLNNLTVNSGGDLNVLGNTNLGNSASNTISLTGSLASNILPSSTNTYNLGATDRYFSTAYITTINAGTLNSSSLSTSGAASFGSTLSLGSVGITFYSGNGVPSNSLGVNGDYYYRKDGSSGSTSVYYKVSGAWTAAGGGGGGPEVDTLASVTARGATTSTALTLSNSSNNITVGTLTATGGSIDGTAIGANVASTGAFTSLSATGNLSALNFSGTSSGTNTGDQLITLTGDVTGSGTGSFATTIGAGKVTSSMILDGTITNTDINSSAAIAYSKLNLTGSVVGGDLASNIIISTSGTINNATISGGTLSGGTVSGSTLSSTGLIFSGSSPNISASTSNTPLTINANGVGTLTLASVSTGDIQFFSSSNKITSAGALTIAGALSASNVSGTTSGSNTGDQLITLTGDVTGSGTGTFAATIGTGRVTTTSIADGTITNTDINSSAAIAYSKLNLTGSVVGGDLASNISISTSGTIATTGSGTITSAGLLTGSAGLTVTGGTVNLNASGSFGTNIGNASGGAIALSTGSTFGVTTTTGSQTFTSAVASTSTTSSGFVFTNNSLNTGTGSYFSSTSLTTGNLAQISTGAANTFTSGNLLYVNSTATSLTSGSLLSLDWSPTSSTTATGDLFSLNVGANALTTGNLFNIKNNGSSLFAVNQTQVTSNLPTQFTAPGDVSVAYDINLTNPTASFIKSQAPLNIQAGESFNSSNLTLKTFNEGQVVIDSAAAVNSALYVTGDTITTGNGEYITANGLTTGNALNIASTSTAGGSSGASYLVNLSRSGTNSNSSHTAYGISSTVTNTGTTSTNIGGDFTATGATTNYGLKVEALTGATSTGLGIGALSGATANTGLSVGNITSAATANNFGINIGSITSQASATSYALNTGAISGAGTATYGINLGANSSTATTNYGEKIGALSGAGTTNYGLYVDTVTGAGTNYAAYFAGGNVNVQGLTASSAIYTDSSHNLTATAPTSGTIGYFTRSGTTISPATSTDNFTITGTTNLNATGAGATNIGNASAGAIALSTGSTFGVTTTTSSQTFTSAVATTGTTTSGFVFTDNSLTSGTGAYISSTSINTGNLAQIDTNGSNSLTSGNLLRLTSSSTGLTTGSLLSLDYSPGSTTATGDLLSLNIGSGASAFAGNLFNLKNNGTSLFSVSQAQVTSSLPAQFSAAGDVSIANDINLTNPTVSFVKSQSSLTIQAGEPFSSAGLILKTFNEGTVAVDASAATGTGFNVTDNSITSGSVASLTSSSTTGLGSGSSYLLNLSRTGANASATHIAYGIASSVTDTGSTSTNVGGDFTATGATTNFGLKVEPLTGATSTGLDIGALSGATTNKGINIGAFTTATTSTGIAISTLASATSNGITIGALSGATANTGLSIGAFTGASISKGITIGNISSTGTTQYGIQLGTLTGGSTSNYQIQTGNITAIASAINAGLVIGTTKAVTGTAASSTNYGININTIDSTGTTNAGLNIGNVSGATNNYAILTSGTGDIKGSNVGSGSNSNSPKLILEGNGFTAAATNTTGSFSIQDTPLSATTAKLMFAVTGFVANANVLSVDQAGNVISKGTNTASSTPDYAENIPVSDQSIGPADVVTIDPNQPGDGSTYNNFTAKKSSQPYDQKVLGVISTSPGSIINAPDNAVTTGQRTKASDRPLALAGRVPVKVSTENGSIFSGDYLTTSSTPGVAMKATRPGQVIGKALENLNSNNGIILMFVNPGFADPSQALAAISLDSNGNLIIPQIATSQLTLNGVSVTNPSTVILEGASRPIGSTTGSDSIASLQNDNTASESAVLGAQIASNSASIADLQTRLQRLEEASQSASPSAEASSSAALAPVSSFQLPSLDFQFNDATVSGTLRSFGDTILGQTTIAGDLSQDGTLSLTNGDTINSIGSNGTLYLQSSPLASKLDVFNGLVTIDKSGHFKAEVITAKKLQIDTSDQTAKTLGSAVIAAGKTSITIPTTALSANSKILVTPQSELDSPLYVTDKTPAQGFTVRIKTKQAKDVNFDWLLVEESNGTN